MAGPRVCAGSGIPSFLFFPGSGVVGSLFPLSTSFRLPLPSGDDRLPKATNHTHTRNNNSHMAPVMMRANAARAPAAPKHTGAARGTVARAPLAARAPAPRDISCLAATLEVLSVDGAKSGSETLELDSAAEDTAEGLVHRYIVMIRQNMRQGTASTKTRSEVRGGGRKPQKQKGTGNARMGSRRTPLRPGGGVVFGPKPKDWSIKMNKKEKRLALATTLMNASCDTVVVEDLDGKFSDRKTKNMEAALQAWGVGRDSKAVLIAKELSDDLMISGRNIERLALQDMASLNAYDILNADRILIEKSAVSELNARFGGSSTEA